jgi:hypothetical protein
VALIHHKLAFLRVLNLSSSEMKSKTWRSSLDQNANSLFNAINPCEVFVIIMKKQWFKHTQERQFTLIHLGQF